MTLDDLNAVAQTLGVVALVVSLVFVGYQLRQNAKHTRAQIQSARVDRLMAQMIGFSDADKCAAVSAILALIVGLALGPWQLARVRRGVKGGVSFITIVPNLVLGVGMLVAYGLCALNIPAGNLDASYFAGLAASVTVGVILLFRITYSMLLPAKPD